MRVGRWAGPRYPERVASSQVPAARNTLKILSLLAAHDVPISAARIRSELQLPRSTTYHLLNELMDAGFVVRIPENRAYGLGLAAYAMASAYTTQQPLVRFATKPLETAARMVGGSGHLSRLAGSEIVYLQEVRAPKALSLVTDVGVRLQAVRAASGRAMLAYLPDKEARAAFSITENVGSLREFRELLAQVRQRGWAEECEEISRGQESVAVPVRDHLSRPAVALAVTFPARSLGDAAQQEVIEYLSKEACAISQRMYGTEPESQRPDT